MNENNATQTPSSDNPHVEAVEPREEPTQTSTIKPVIDQSSATSSSEKPEVMQQNTKPRKSPLETTWFFFKLTFEWITALVLKGWWRPLEQADVYDLPAWNKANVIYPRFNAQWEKRKSTGKLFVFVCFFFIN